MTTIRIDAVELTDTGVVLRDLTIAVDDAGRDVETAAAAPMPPAVAAHATDVTRAVRAELEAIALGLGTDAVDVLQRALLASRDAALVTATSAAWSTPAPGVVVGVAAAPAVPAASSGTILGGLPVTGGPLDDWLSRHSLGIEPGRVVPGTPDLLDVALAHQAQWRQGLAAGAAPNGTVPDPAMVRISGNTIFSTTGGAGNVIGTSGPSSLPDGGRATFSSGSYRGGSTSASAPPDLPDPTD
jgi:hypothetical protein